MKNNSICVVTSYNVTHVLFFSIPTPAKNVSAPLLLKFTYQISYVLPSIVYIYMHHYNKSVYLSFKLKLFNSAIGYNFNAKILLHTKNARTKWSILGNQLNEPTANPPTRQPF